MEQGGWNLFAFVKNQPTFLKNYVGLISWGAKKVAPDPHPDLPKYSIDFWRIGNIISWISGGLCCFNRNKG